MSFCTVRNVFVSGLILAFATAAVAQEGDKLNDLPRLPFYGSDGSTLIAQLVKPGVQEELRLDESKSKPLLDSLREIDPKHVAFRTPEDRQQIIKIRDEVTQKSQAAIQKFLSEEQFRRFQQVEMQYLGGRALLTAEIAQKFALTAEQQERLKAIRNAFVAGASGPNNEDSSVRVERYKNDLLAVLSPDQIIQWKAMTGAPFKVPQSFSGPSWRLVFEPEVQKELGLSETGVAMLRHSLTLVQIEGAKERSRSGEDWGGRDPADRKRKSQQIIDTVRSTLAVSQWNRLQELILQQIGPESLNHHEVSKELGLSEDQRDRVREIIAKYRQSLIDGGPLQTQPKELSARRKKEQADLLEILTPDQKTHWEAMQGAKVDEYSLLRPKVSPAEKQRTGN